MSDQKQCDRPGCGTIHDPNESARVAMSEQGASVTGLTLWGGDLCPDCQESFKQWWRNDPSNL